MKVATFNNSLIFWLLKLEPIVKIWPLFLEFQIWQITKRSDEAQTASKTWP